MQDSNREDDEPSEESDISIMQLNNKNYMAYIGILGEDYLELYVMNNRARKIQFFYRLRHYIRVQSAKLIQLQWRKHVRNRDIDLFRRERLNHFKKKVAVNRIYEFSKLIKVRKVSASVMLNYMQVNQNVQQAIYRAAQLECQRQKMIDDKTSSGKNTAASASN